MTSRILTALAALPIAAVSTVALAGPASATEPEPCYENRGDVCPEPEPTQNSYNLIVGTRFADTIFGTFGADAIFARGGNDRVVGRFGNDLLFGGRGNDTLSGGFGRDIIRGGAGFDICIGSVDDVFLSCESVLIEA